MDAGATQVGIFSKQVWVLSGERHHLEGSEVSSNDIKIVEVVGRQHFSLNDGEVDLDG